eukprot:2419843-Pleurochrysis_carterae.AAC.1
MRFVLCVAARRRRSRSGTATSATTAKARSASRRRRPKSDRATEGRERFGGRGVGVLRLGVGSERGKRREGRGKKGTHWEREGEGEEEALVGIQDAVGTVVNSGAAALTQYLRIRCVTECCAKHLEHTLRYLAWFFFCAKAVSLRSDEVYRSLLKCLGL